MSTGSARAADYLLSGIVFLLLLTPSMAWVPGLPAFRLESLVFLVVYGLFLVSAAIRGQFRFPLTTRATLLLAMGSVAVASTTYGALALEAVAWVDLLEALNFVNLAMLCCLMASAREQALVAEASATRLMDHAIVAGCLLSAIAVQQTFDLFGLNQHYVSVVAPTQAQSLLEAGAFRRPVGMVGNPNELGFLAVLLLLAATYRYMTTRRGRYLACLALFLAMLFFTLSRSAAAALVGGVGVLCMVFWARGEHGADRIRIAPLLVLGTIGVAFFILPDLYATFGWRFVTDAQDPSLQARYAGWREHAAVFVQHPLLGAGPLRAGAFDKAADNDWILLLRSYGLVGTVLFVAVLLFPSLSQTKGQSLSLGAVAAAAAYMVTAGVVRSPVLLTLLVLLLAASDDTAHTRVAGGPRRKFNKHVHNPPGWGVPRFPSN